MIWTKEYHFCCPLLVLQLGNLLNRQWAIVLVFLFFKKKKIVLDYILAQIMHILWILFSNQQLVQEFKSCDRGQSWMEEKRVPRTWRPGDIVPNVLREGAAASRGKSLPSTQQLERATGVRRRFESIDRTVNQYNEFDSEYNDDRSTWLMIDSSSSNPLGNKLLIHGNRYTICIVITSNHLGKQAYI